MGHKKGGNLKQARDRNSFTLTRKKTSSVKSNHLRFAKEDLKKELKKSLFHTDQVCYIDVCVCLCEYVSKEMERLETVE